jgi:hypothetical protein
MKQEALNVLSKGIAAIPDYEEGGKARLAMSLQQIEHMPDEPLQVEEPLPETDTTNGVSDTAGGVQDSTVETSDSTPTVAMAQ